MRGHRQKLNTAWREMGTITSMLVAEHTGNVWKDILGAKPAAPV